MELFSEGIPEAFLRGIREETPKELYVTVALIFLKAMVFGAMVFRGILESICLMKHIIGNTYELSGR